MFSRKLVKVFALFRTRLLLVCCFGPHKPFVWRPKMTAPGHGLGVAV